jgi:hypothetical protein
MINFFAYLIFAYILPNWLCTEGWRGRVYMWFVDRAGRHAYGSHP